MAITKLSTSTVPQHEPHPFVAAAYFFNDVIEILKYSQVACVSWVNHAARNLRFTTSINFNNVNNKTYH